LMETSESSGRASSGASGLRKVRSADPVNNVAGAALTGA
jgi:hypothetical protein